MSSVRRRAVCDLSDGVPHPGGAVCAWRRLAVATPSSLCAFTYSMRKGLTMDGIRHRHGNATIFFGLYQHPVFGPLEGCVSPAIVGRAAYPKDVFRTHTSRRSDSG